MKKPSLYPQPLDLLVDCLRSKDPADLATWFAPEGEGIFLQEVVDAARVRTMEDLLDAFSIDTEDPHCPKPETEEWWMIYEWHPVRKQLIRGEELRERLKRERLLLA